MKIVCGSCGAKYSIADEKVQGKVFKIRCKKCSNVIVVKGDSQHSDGQSQEAFGDSNMSGAYGGTSAAAEWYVVVDGDQVGPISPEEIEAYFASGRVQADSFAWREGLGDWIALGELDEFAHLAAMSGADGADATALMQSPLAGGNDAPASQPGYDSMPADEDATSLMPAADFRAQIAAKESEAQAAAQDGEYDQGAEFDQGGEYDAPGGFDSSSGAGSQPAMDVQQGSGAFASGDSSAGGYDAFGDNADGGYDAGGYDDGGGYDAGGYDAYDDDADNQGMFASFDSGADGAESGYDSFDGVGADSGSESGVAAANDMIGQRNENSVLFSLSSLDQVSAVSGDEGAQSAPAAAGGADGGAVTEGSGLIDIQALASAQKSMKGNAQSGGADGGGAEDPFGAGTMSMPALMPMGSHKSNKGLYIFGGLLALLLVGAIVVGAYVLLTKDDTPKVVERIVEREVAPANPAADEKGADKAEAQAAEAAAAAQAVDSPGDGSEDDDSAVAAADSEDDKKDDSDKAKKDEPKKSASNRPTRSAPKPKPKPKPKPSSSSSKGDDDIFSLLDKKGGDKKAAEKDEPAPSSNKPKKLTRSMVQRTVGKYKGRVHSCYTSNNRNKMSGAVYIKYTIKPSGRVSSASITTAKFKGTDVGTCVARVVRSMKFPATQSSLPVNYPFMLK